MLQSVLHAVAALLFVALSLGTFAFIAAQLNASRELIVAILSGENHSAALRPWPARVRLVSRSCPSPACLTRQLRATA